MNEKKRYETVGQASLDLWDRVPEAADATEQMREMLTDYDKYLFEALNAGKENSSYIGCDFYVVVITKREPKMPNVFRNYFFTRLSCPTPDYDQTVYKYHRKESNIEFLWVIPTKAACEDLLSRIVDIAPEERELFKFVIDFKDGALFRKACELNFETKPSPVITIEEKKND
jgi:hypothetical protein